VLTPIRLAWRSLVYHRRGNIAVALGVAVGSAVLTGALLVGDSLREGLRALSLSQLGWVHQTLAAPRFIGAHIVQQLPAEPICGAIIVRGAITADAGSGSGSTTQANIIGAPADFWTAGEIEGKASAPIDSAWWNSDQSEVAVNRTLAETLSLKAGDMIEITVERASAVPRESLLGRKDASDVVSRIRVQVREILGDVPMASFSPRPGLEPPKNVFLPLGLLQRELRQNGRINMVLAGPGDAGKKLHDSLTLEDWGLRVLDPARRTEDLFRRLDHNHDGILQPHEWKEGLGSVFAREASGRDNADLTKKELSEYLARRHGYISLESQEIILSPAVERTALEAAASLHMRAAPTLVYLANAIADGGHSLPYSIVAALDPGLAPPLGPFLPEGGGPLRDDEIILVDWKESGLAVKPGDRIHVRYFDPQATDLPERSHDFRLKALVPLGGASADQDLTPPFPGVTDKLDIRNWDPPFPYDNRRITTRDEAYWNQYRTTPKAYVTLAAGRALWGSRFGQSTSIRLAPPADRALAQAAAEFERELLSRLRSEDGGLSFVPVRQQALEAANAGTSEFGWLFLAFSTFLVAAALMLVSLIVKLNLEQRSAQLGVLSALGWPGRQIRRVLLTEQAIVCGIGAVLGLAGAWLYARYLLTLLRAQWPTALQRDVTAFRFEASGAGDMAIGAVAAWLLAMITVFLAARGMLSIAPRELLAGYRAGRTSTSRAGRWSKIVAVGCAVLAILSLAAGFFVKDAESRASSFFSSGALALAAGVLAVRRWMMAHARSRQRNWQPSVVSLAIQNSCRAIGRSLTTIAVVASAIFVIVAVSSFHRGLGAESAARTGGTGGFALVGRSTVPIFQDLNTPEGRNAAGLRLNPSWLEGTSIWSLRARQGDDASCLNLYEPNRPRIIGVGKSWITRGGFPFADSLASSDAEKHNPWLLLEGDSSSGIPAIADAATATWKLHKKLGDTIDSGSPGGQKLRLVALLDESILQSDLVISEANFVLLFPREEGYTEFFIETADGQAVSVRRALETALAAQGFEAVSTKDRLEAYLGVENAYLGTFQALGSLGLVLGSLGVAIVLVRTVWERRGELALLRALGFRRRVLRVLLFTESAVLLVLGLTLGTLAAVLAVAPEVKISEGAKVLGHTAALVALTLIVSLGAAGLAVAMTLRAKLIEALRTE
jgi:ABC-type lipoprotein release transport system permease subunit